MTCVILYSVTAQSKGGCLSGCGSWGPPNPLETKRWTSWKHHKVGPTRPKKDSLRSIHCRLSYLCIKNIYIYVYVYAYAYAYICRGWPLPKSTEIHVGLQSAELLHFPNYKRVNDWCCLRLVAFLRLSKTVPNHFLNRILNIFSVSFNVLKRAFN